MGLLKTVESEARAIPCSQGFVIAPKNDSKVNYDCELHTFEKNRRAPHDQLRGPYYATTSLFGNRSKDELYQRNLVVSAYAVSTNEFTRALKKRVSGRLCLFADAESDGPGGGRRFTKLVRFLTPTSTARCLRSMVKASKPTSSLLIRVEGVRGCSDDLQRCVRMASSAFEGTTLLTARQMLAVLRSPQCFSTLH